MKHEWEQKDNHEACKNCDAKREKTPHGWQHWIVIKTPTPGWMRHLVKEDTIDFPVLFGAAVPKCARGLELLDL